MWLQRWLGSIYARGWHSLKTELFTAERLADLLNIKLGKVKVALTLLKKSRAAVEFAREGRKAVYRFVDPRVYFLIEAGAIKNVGRIPPRYFHLVAEAVLELSSLENVVGAAIYGSVARGDYRSTSDVDTLVVSKELPRSLAKRIDRFLEVEKKLEGELSFLASRGIHTHLSWTPLTLDELAEVPPVVLDIAEEGIVVFERNGVLTELLASVRDKLAEIGAKKLRIGKTWCWDLGFGWDSLAIETPEAS